MRKNLAALGFLLTAVYLLIIVYVVFTMRGSFSELELNTLGDFLAGAFSPLAFLWLVLGFLQQGRELKLSSDALVLQAAELKNSVDEQKKAVAQQARMASIAEQSLAQQSIAGERMAEPMIEIQEVKRTLESDSLKLLMTNHASSCENVRCSLEYAKDNCPLIASFNYLTDGMVYELDLTGNAIPKIGVSLVIRYKKITGAEGVQRFTLRYNYQLTSLTITKWDLDALRSVGMDPDLPAQ